jgi:hypothetical protein
MGERLTEERQPTESSPCDSRELLDKMAADPQSSAAMLMEIARSDRRDLLLRVAQHPKATAEVLDHLAKRQDWHSPYRWSARSTIVEHPNTSPETIGYLARQSVPHTILDDSQPALSSPRCPVDVLTDLALTDCPLSRHAIAHNPSTPIEVIVMMLLARGNLPQVTRILRARIAVGR